MRAIRRIRVPVQAPTSGGGGIPAWARGAIGEWVDIPATNTLQSVMPPYQMSDGSPGGFFAYSGGALHPDTLVYYAVGGGHRDNYFNGVFAFPLAAELPTWTSQFAGTQPVGGKLNGGALSEAIGRAYYWDGRPASRHTWGGDVQVIPSYGTQGQVVFFSASAVWGSGNESYDTMDAWDIASKDYTWLNPDPIGNPNGPNPNFTSGAGGAARGAWACSKDSRGKVWARFYNLNGGYDDRLALWDPATKSWSSAIAITRHSAEIMVYDSFRDRMVLLPSAAGDPVMTWNALDGSNVQTHGMWSSPPPNTRGVAWYEPNIDRYVFMPRANSDYWLVHPTTWACTQVVTTVASGSTRPTVSGTTAPGPDQGPDTLFHFIPQYRGCVFFSQVGARVSFIRTS